MRTVWSSIRWRDGIKLLPQSCNFCHIIISTFFVITRCCCFCCCLPIYMCVLENFCEMKCDAKNHTLHRERLRLVFTTMVITMKCQCSVKSEYKSNNLATKNIFIPTQGDGRKTLRLSRLSTKKNITCSTYIFLHVSVAFHSCVCVWMKNKNSCTGKVTAFSSFM